MGRASIGFDKNSKADLNTFQILMTVHRKGGTFFFKELIDMQLMQLNTI